MTDAKKERIKELEDELAPLLVGTNGFEERYNMVQAGVSGIVSGRFLMELSREDYEVLTEYSERIIELGRLYDELVYKPDKDEKTLDYLFRDGMTAEEKLEALADAWWYATNSGYSDAMANRLMAGEEDAQTQRWEQLCRDKTVIARYHDYLKELVEHA